MTSGSYVGEPPITSLVHLSPLPSHPLPQEIQTGFTVAAHPGGVWVSHLAVLQVGDEDVLTFWVCDTMMGTSVDRVRVRRSLAKLLICPSRSLPSLNHTLPGMPQLNFQTLDRVQHLHICAGFQSFCFSSYGVESPLVVDTPVPLPCL